MDRAELPDPKPSFPYEPGFQISIQAHKPPAPFGRLYRPDPRSKSRKSPNELRKLTQSQYVSDNLPLESDADALKSERATLSIIKPIAAQDLRGAQLVLCDIEPHDDNNKYRAVAKIYDALYYPFWGGEDQREPLDVVYQADKDYTWEAAAYDHLNANAKLVEAVGTSIPRYYGSWTFTLPLVQSGITLERPVRLILIEDLEEDLHGVTMENLLVNNGRKDRDAFHYQEGFRLEVLKKILDARVHLESIGILRSDLNPSKVMLVPRPKPDSTAETNVRVVLIGYHRTTVLEKTEGFEDSGPRKRNSPKNPKDVFKSNELYELSGWAPSDWTDNLDKQRKWLEDQFGNEKMRARYGPPDSTNTVESTEKEGPEWRDKVTVL